METIHHTDSNDARTPHTHNSGHAHPMNEHRTRRRASCMGRQTLAHFATALRPATTDDLFSLVRNRLVDAHLCVCVCVGKTY